MRQTHFSNFFWLYRDYIAMYNNNKLGCIHTSHVQKISPSLPVITLSPIYSPKISLLLLTLLSWCFLVGVLWFMPLVFMIYCWWCWAGTRRVGWDELQWAPALSFSAKVNNELSYRTICCRWSVTHGFWTAASILPACLLACSTNNGQTLNNSSCHLRKYTLKGEQLT